MPRLRCSITLLFSLALAACSGSLISSDERADLVEGRRKWEARGFTDYAIGVRSGCFCPEH